MSDKKRTFPFLDSSLFRIISYLLPFGILLVAFLFFYKIYTARVNAFGCFDDCFNIIGGYWLTQGKTIYTDFFFNHHPGMAFISAGIQQMTQPVNIYELILRHRQFVVLFGLVANSVLVLRFRWAAVGFVLLYEVTKFYLFGDRFLAEGLIVYPLVCLVGLVILSLQNKKLYTLDYVIAAFATWFVLFMREPYNPLVLLLFGILVWSKLRQRNVQIGVGVFGLLTLGTLFTFPLQEFYFNVITINAKVFGGDVGVQEIGYAFFYPFIIFVEGSWNVLRTVEIGSTAIFLLCIVAAWKQGKKKLVIVLFLLLGVSNLRATPPGFLFYEAFHMLPWYGILLFSTGMLVGELPIKIRLVSISTLIGLCIYFIASPQTYLRDQQNQHEAYLTQYGHYASYGEAIRLLSKPTDTLFVDGFDELIHWQAKLPSGYRYTWYTSAMPQFPVYADARGEMFSNTPPMFYYGSCPKERSAYRLLPERVKNDYQQIDLFGKPSCLYIHKDKLNSISTEQWQKVKELGYELPPKE